MSSSFKKTSKASGRVHRERSQPENRRHLGILEKKKDYRLRADDHQKKETTIKKLRQKALLRNPDEFYFKMVNTSMQNGVHQCEESTAPVYTDEQLKLMTTQDIKYIRYKRQLELKKIEKLRSSLHLIDTQDVKPKSHIIFVDSAKEAKNYDLSKHFGGISGSDSVNETVASSVERRSNRLSHLPQIVLPTSKTPNGESSEGILSARQAYRQLATRLKRVEQLSIVLSKMETKQRLRDEEKTVDPKLAARLGRRGRPKLIVPESVDAAPVYKWPMRRQK